MSTDEKKDRKKFLLAIGIAYVVLFAFMIYRAQQSPGTCPFLSLCGSQGASKASETKPAVVVNKKAEETKLPTLLELGSKTCVPCHMMESVLEKLEKGYGGVLNVKFIDLNLKENTSIGIKYKINRIPVQVFLDADGKELWRHEGYFPAENIVEQWKKLGYDLKALKKEQKAVKGTARE
jgi:thioredoxin 1